MDKRTIVSRLLIFVVLVFGYVSSQSTVRNRKTKISNVDRFGLSIFPKVLNADSVEIFTLLEIPFYSVQFIKKNKKFIASYNLSVSLQDDSGKEVGHMIWSDSIIVDSYKETRLILKNRKYSYKFNIAKQKYKILAELLDNDTRKRGNRQIRFDYSNLKKSPNILEPYFLIGERKDWAFGKENLPSYGKRLKGLNDSLGICISGFIKKGKYDILVEINYQNEESIIDTISDISEKYFFEKIILFESSRFNLINNKIRIKIVQGKKSKSKDLILSIYKSGLSQFVYDIDLGIKQMRYLLKGDNRKMFKGKNKSEKEELFYKFWKSKDPTPNTEENELMEEYFSRVAYANENFNSWGQGWETDMGMIYILFGPPDEVQRSNPTSSSQTTYQVWTYYNLNKQYVFKDLNGFGDYRLDSPFMGANF